MNILHFCQLYPPLIYGGGEYIFFQWAKELVSRGHTVFTITQKIKGKKDFEKINGINVYRVGPPIEYKGTLPPSLFRNFGYIVSAIVKGIALLARHRIEIIHSNTYSPALAGQFCATMFREPHIVTFHDVYSLEGKNFWEKWASQRDTGGAMAIMGPKVEEAFLKLPATAFHTVSRTSKQDLMRYNAKRIIVIPNGVNLEDYDGVGCGKINIHQAVYIGRLIFYKNLGTLIKSMKKVVEEISDSKLVIIGDGPSRKTLEMFVKKLNLTQNVTFTGRVSHEEKVEIIKESAFLVLPSVCEGFGITILESFACRRPVIVSNVMPLPEIVQNDKDGLLIAPFNSEDWEKAVTFLFSHPHKAKKMGLSGRLKLEQEYTIQKIVDKLEQMYERFA